MVEKSKKKKKKSLNSKSGNLKLVSIIIRCSLKQRCNNRLKTQVFVFTVSLKRNRSALSSPFFYSSLCMTVVFFYLFVYLHGQLDLASREIFCMSAASFYLQDIFLYNILSWKSQ